LAVLGDKRTSQNHFGSDAIDPKATFLVIVPLNEGAGRFPPAVASFQIATGQF
jgi:hypothetical protein